MDLVERENFPILKKELLEKNENSKFERRQTLRMIMRPGKKIMLKNLEIDCDFNNIVTECCSPLNPKL
jgi:hypothetical protein